MLCVCGVVGGVAADILNRPLAELEITSRKLRYLFAEDLQLAAPAGTIGCNLFGVWMLLRTSIKSDTRSNEQYNSLIRVLNERARNVGLDTVSARANIKIQLGVGTRGVNLKWSAIRPHAAQMLANAIEHHGQAIMLFDLLVYPNTSSSLQASSCNNSVQSSN